MKQRKYTKPSNPSVSGSAGSYCLFGFYFDITHNTTSFS